MSLFNFFGSIFGYLLWFLYEIFKNYGVAIIFFTLITKLIFLPFAIRQQKSMAGQGKMAAKTKELREKYGDNQVKYNEELQKYYEKEGINPASGCLTTLIPFPLMLGIYYSVINPLQNTLHISKTSIAAATDLLSKIPGVSITGNYLELEVLKHFNELKAMFVANNTFTAAELEKIEFFNSGFKLLGLNLLDTAKGSPFTSFLWIIPVLCLLSYWLQQWIMQKLSPNGTQPEGCMKAMFWVLPIISAFWAYTMPAAVGTYWVVSCILGIAQSIYTRKFFGPERVNAKLEIAHMKRMELEEAAVKPLPEELSRKIAEKLAPRAMPEQPERKASEPLQKKKKPAAKNTNSDEYRGTKK